MYEELRTLIKKNVEKLGNQGAINLAPVLNEIVDVLPTEPSPTPKKICELKVGHYEYDSFPTTYINELNADEFLNISYNELVNIITHPETHLDLYDFKIVNKKNTSGNYNYIPQISVTNYYDNSLTASALAYTTGGTPTVYLHTYVFRYIQADRQIETTYYKTEPFKHIEE